MKNTKLKKCLLTLTLILTIILSIFIFASCEEEPTETITILYEDMGDGLVITGYEGVLDRSNELKIPSSIGGKNVIAIADNAFEERKDLGAILLPSTIVSIGEEAFKNCVNLVSVNIPTNVTEIRSETFYGCESIVEIDIPENIAYIADDAFEGCDSIQRLTTPGWALGKFDVDDLRSLNIRGDITVSEGMFSGFRRLESLTIPYIGSDINASGKTHFGYLFGAPDAQLNNKYIPSTLSKVVITGGSAEALKVIDDNAFFGCSSITTVMLPNNLETIGISAFENCENLTKINIPASIRYIAEGAFANTNIESVTIPASIENISARAFENCDNLRSLSLGKNVKTISNGAFSGCISLESLNVSSIEQWLSFSFDSWLDSPLYYAGALYIGGKSAESITIPQNVTSINANAFYRCTNLKSITLHDGIEAIGDYAFAGCTALENIKIVGKNEANVLPASLKTIGYAAFSNCKSITSITIPESTTAIGDFAFNLCTSLKEVSIHANVTNIGESTFRAAALTNITITSPITSVGANAFAECTRIREVTAPIAVISAISKTSLENVTITDGDVLAEGLFAGAKKLKTVTIPNSITEIQKDAFKGCSSLCSVKFDSESSLQAIGEGAFSYCESLTRFTVTKNLVSIGDLAFAGCYRLKEIYNNSTLSIIAKEESANGGIARYAFSVKLGNEASGYFETNNYLFYNGENGISLVGYFGKNTVLTLPTLDGVEYTIADFAFVNSDVRIIFIPEQVLVCGENTFKNAISIKEIEAPVSIIDTLSKETKNGIETIKFNTSKNVQLTATTLNGLTSLKSLSVSAGVSAIDAYALAQLSNLTSITVSAQNTLFKSIDGHLYMKGANGDTLVRACPMSADYFSLPTTVIKIGDYAFYNCDLLTNVYIESGSVLSDIGVMAFYDSDILYSLELPSTISLIGENAFLGCDYLSDIEINGESERYYTAGGCLIDKTEKTVICAFGEKIKITEDGKTISVTACTIPSDGSVLKVDHYAAFQQTTIEMLVIPNNVEIFNDSFAGLSALERIVVEGQGKYISVDGCLIDTATKTLVLGTLTSNIPADGSVTNISEYAFAYNNAITSVTIPETIVTVEDHAFINCTSLVNVTSPAKFLNETIFEGCEVITGITVIGADAIEESTLSSFVSLESISIEKNVPSVAEAAFKANVLLSKISVNSENTAIKAVNGCLIDVNSKTLITAVSGIDANDDPYPILPDDGSVTKVGAYAFAGREKFEFVYIPGSVTYIDSTAFDGTKGLLKVAIPAEFAGLVPAETVTELTVFGNTLSADALMGYSALKSIEIGKTVSTIEAFAFANTPTLESISVAEENQYYTAKSGALIYTPEKKMIAAIGKCIVPTDGSVQSIVNAFAGNTMVTSVIIPVGVSVQDNFEGCVSLETVYYGGTDWDNFKAEVNMPDGVTVYIYSETQPTTEGNFWYVKDGRLMIWW